MVTFTVYNTDYKRVKKLYDNMAMCLLGSLSQVSDDVRMSDIIEKRERDKRIWYFDVNLGSLSETNNIRISSGNIRIDYVGN